MQEKGKNVSEDAYALAHGECTNDRHRENSHGYRLWKHLD